jgi:hypothetical protein
VIAIVAAEPTTDRFGCATEGGRTLTIPHPFTQREPWEGAEFHRYEHACRADGGRRNELTGDSDEALSSVIDDGRMP